MSGKTLKLRRCDFKVFSLTFQLETWDKGDKIMAVDMVSVSSMSHGQTYFPGFHPNCFAVPFPCSTYTPSQGLFRSCLEKSQKADSCQDVNG